MGKNKKMDTENKDWFKFSIKKAYGILIYYGILFIIALLLALTGVLNEVFFTTLTLIEKSVISGIGFSILGAVIYYSKKIYKSCVNLDFTNPKDENDAIREFGVSAYFIFRPPFAIIFSLLLILSIKLGFTSISVEIEKLNSGFIYLTSFLSFFCGYSSGDVLDVFESNGKGIVNKIFNKKIL